MRVGAQVDELAEYRVILARGPVYPDFLTLVFISRAGGVGGKGYLREY